MISDGKSVYALLALLSLSASFFYRVLRLTAPHESVQENVGGATIVPALPSPRLMWCAVNPWLSDGRIKDCMRLPFDEEWMLPDGPSELHPSALLRDLIANIYVAVPFLAPSFGHDPNHYRSLARPQRPS